MRIKVTISYDGSKFNGFQQQAHDEKTVLGKLYHVCKKLNINTQIVGSGRTDKHVHANNQVLHVDIPPFWSDIKKLQNALNAHLHPFIHVKRVEFVSDEFHARFSVKKREYRYLLSHEDYTPYQASYVHFTPSLHVEKLNFFLKLFEGKHNFEMFKKNGSDVKNCVRTIFLAKAYRYKNITIITLQSNGFLRSQVRMIVASVLLAFEKKITKEQILEQLTCKVSHSTTLAPAEGLYLNRVFY